MKNLVESRAAALSDIRDAIASLANPGTEQIEISGVDLRGTGAVCTSSKLLEAHIQPILEASDVDSVAAAIDETQRSLASLGIFKDVIVSLDPHKVVIIELPAANKYVAKTGTKVGQSEGSGYFSGAIKNLFGFGEILNVDVSTGTRTRASQLVDVSVPIPAANWTYWKAQGLAYKSEKIVEWASHRAQITGFTARLQSRDHSVGVDAVLRTIMATKLKPSEAIREAAGNTFKLSAFWNWQYDSRPNALLADSGSFVGLKTEFAGGPSDFPFMKAALDTHSGFNIFKSVSGSFSTKLGLLVPLSGSRSHIFDRFTLGGALDMRAFRLNHAGPHDGIDAIGGNVLAAAGLSLFAPIPRVASPNLKIHAFLNGGFLGQSVTSLMSSLPSVSSGFGILYAHPSARFELNVAFPLVAHSGELTHKGLQFGVGLEFM